MHAIVLKLAGVHGVDDLSSADVDWFERGALGRRQAEPLPRLDTGSAGEHRANLGQEDWMGNVRARTTATKAASILASVVVAF